MCLGGTYINPLYPFVELSEVQMAIGTESKMFLASPIVQKLVNDIYTGRIVFSMKSHRSVLADNYKPRSIEIYDVSKAPFLDHYRLRVPKYGAILEFCNFGVLLFLFLLCLSSKDFILCFLISLTILPLQGKDLAKVTPFEVMFIVFATAFALEEYTASKEHGWGSEYYMHHR